MNDDELINRSVSEFRDGVIKNNPRKALKYINLPYRAVIDGKQVKVATEEQFISLFSKIYDERVKQEIANAVPRAMFSRYDGIMLGVGVVWFDSLGKVIN